MDVYNSQCATLELYVKMLTDFMSKCASKGSGVKRGRFNWLVYKERAYKAREVRRGVKVQEIHRQFEHDSSAVSRGFCSIAGVSFGSPGYCRVEPRDLDLSYERFVPPQLC